MAATILRRALAEASRRLAAPGCLAVLTEFQDQRGRPLADNLGALNLTITRYLQMIVFVKGDEDRRCSTASRSPQPTTGSFSSVLGCCCEPRARIGNISSPC